MKLSAELKKLVRGVESTGNQGDHTSAVSADTTTSPVNPRNRNRFH